MKFESLMAIIDKPELVNRPRQLVNFLTRPRQQFCTVELPWGITLPVNTSETIGYILWRKGVYDLIVTEAIYRVAEAGCTVIDIGANIGYTTGLMAKKVGPSGRVLSFEPHPQIFKELTKNVENWRHNAELADIELFQCALSNRAGEGFLFECKDFAHNNMLAHLVTDSNNDTLPVPLKRLDEFESLTSHGPVTLVKIDVEGHELSVLQGAANLLATKSIRNIIFEDHDEAPTPVMHLLQEAGYTLYSLGRSFWGPLLCAIDDCRGLHWGEAPNYIATSEPDRLTELFRVRGWQCFVNL